jgi:hypothetical protein
MKNIYVEKFRIVEQFSTYSKRKGAYYKNITIEKDIDTLEEAQRKVTEYKPSAQMKSPTEYRTKGLLYPGSIFIKKHKVICKA